MQSEIKKCRNCTKDFIIEIEDFGFYEKMQVPPPTWCPTCRLQRRLTFFNLIKLYKRKCDLCKTDFIAMYHSDAPYKIYCPTCWWGDSWDPTEYGRDFDFSRPFFEQFKELWQQVPVIGISLGPDALTTSPYANHADYIKNCYLVFSAGFAEDCSYSVYLENSKNIYDSAMVMFCEYAYDCHHLFKSNKCVGCRGNVTESIGCYFLRDCNNCQDCIASSNLQNKRYCIFNEQYTKEEYFKKLELFDLGSYKNYQTLQKQAEEFWKTQTPKPIYNEFNIDATGSYVFQSKNCKEGYDVSNCENCKYVMLLSIPPITDCYDVTNWGQNLDSSYESCIVGENASHMLFSQESGKSASYIEYSKLAAKCSYQFGSVSIRKRDYCIFNRPYEKEEYFKLRRKIIEHMKQTGEYGEFFPIELSPFDYQHTLAHNFFPLTPEQLKEKNYTTYADIKNEYTATIHAKNLPDHIRDVDDSILNEIIECQETGDKYRITPAELQFLRYMNLPLPHTAPLTRIEKKINMWVHQMQLIERVSNLSGETFKTPYTVEEAPYIMSPEEYKREFLG